MNMSMRGMQSSSRLHSWPTLVQYLHASPIPDSVLQQILLILVTCTSTLQSRHMTTVSIYGKSLSGWARISCSSTLKRQKTLFLVQKYKVKGAQLDSMKLKTTDQATNLDVINLNSLIKPHKITTITKSTYYHLKNIVRLKGFLSKQDTEKHLHICFLYVTLL